MTKSTRVFLINVTVKSLVCRGLLFEGGVRFVSLTSQNLGLVLNDVFVPLVIPPFSRFTQYSSFLVKRPVTL